MGLDAACRSDIWDSRHDTLLSIPILESVRMGTCDTILLVNQTESSSRFGVVRLALPLVGSVHLGKTLTFLSPRFLIYKRKVIILPPWWELKQKCKAISLGSGNK